MQYHLNKRGNIVATKIILLTFDGYWRENAINSIPSKSGIYIVYEGSYNSQSDLITLHKVIYIGESENVNTRISGHEKWRPDWRKHCGGNKELCFTFAHVMNPDRERGEAALIYKHKPPTNDEYKYSFPFDETTMNLSGKIVLLTTPFTVQRKDW